MLRLYVRSVGKFRNIGIFFFGNLLTTFARSQALPHSCQVKANLLQCSFPGSAWECLFGGSCHQFNRRDVPAANYEVQAAGAAKICISRQSRLCVSERRKDSLFFKFYILELIDLSPS